MSIKINASFPVYNRFSPKVPIFCVTPNEGRIIHRFFDTSPFSPSGKFLAGFRMPFEDRPPRPGEKGEIVVVDLETAEEHVVAHSGGWESQMGANINWGPDDRTLVFNNVDSSNWEVYGVRLDWPSGRSERFAKGVYHVSRDGRYAACANLAVMRRTQSGYGVVLPDAQTPHFTGLRDDDGVWITDLETLETRLLISIREAVERTYTKSDLHQFRESENYFFHTKWNPQGTRLMFSLRRYPKTDGKGFNMMCGGEMKFDVFTITPDGGELYNALDAKVWENCGHHTNWYPDGKRLSLNLAIDGGSEVKFCKVNYDGNGLEKIFDTTAGSGHPTIHLTEKFLVTDAYLFEPLAFGDGTIPLRLVDLQTGVETTFARIAIQPLGHNTNSQIELRLDPHPAWDSSWRYLAFNGIADGTRRIFVADMQSYAQAYKSS